MSAADTTGNPMAAMLSFAKSIRAAPDRDEKLARYKEGLAETYRAVQALAQAWKTEDDFLMLTPRNTAPVTAKLVPTPGPAAQGERNPNFLAFLKTEPSVRKAAKAALFFAGPMGAAAIARELDQARFKWGKGVPGDLVRSALWHSRKAGELVSDRAGIHDFASPEQRKAFEDKVLRKEVKHFETK
jgi:hypothetical protein